MSVPILAEYTEHDIAYYMTIVKNLVISSLIAKKIFIKYPQLFIASSVDIKENWHILRETLGFSESEAAIVFEEQPWILAQIPDNFNKKISEEFSKNRFAFQIKNDILNGIWSNYSNAS